MHSYSGMDTSVERSRILLSTQRWSTVRLNRFISVEWSEVWCKFHFFNMSAGSRGDECFWHIQCKIKDLCHIKSLYQMRQISTDGNNNNNKVNSWNKKSDSCGPVQMHRVKIWKVCANGFPKVDFLQSSSSVI